MSSGRRVAPGLRLVCCAGLVLGLPPAAAQQSNIDFSVSGTSTIRSWTCTVSGSVQVTPGGASPALPGFSTGIQSATLTVPVKAFACPNEEMTRHLLEAMEADKFPQITFRLDRYEMKGGRAEATGMLTITDVTAPISVPVSLKASGQALQLEGNTRLDMTRFGVDPPVVMLGLLKVGPQIRIEFRGTIAR